MANIPLMCSLFRINCVLKIEIEQLEEKLDAIKDLAWLNLSAETLSNNYKVKIASKKAQIVGNRSCCKPYLLQPFNSKFRLVNEG